MAGEHKLHPMPSDISPQTDQPDEPKPGEDSTEQTSQTEAFEEEGAGIASKE